MSSVQEEIVALVNAAVEVAVLDELRAVRVELDDQRGLVTAQARVIGELLAWREGQGGAAPAPAPPPVVVDPPAPPPVDPPGSVRWGGKLFTVERQIYAKPPEDPHQS